MIDNSKPFTRAIVFEECEDYAGGPKFRSVRDICQVPGTDKNARRRLRRIVTRGYIGDVSQVLYETYHGDDAEIISEDVTRHYKKAIANA